MATQKQKPRRITVPAGMDYVIVKPDTTIYRADADGYSQPLAQLIKMETEKAFIAGQKSRMEEMAGQQSCNYRPPTNEETLEKVLIVIRRHDWQDQHKIISAMLNEMGKDRANRVKDLAQDVARMYEMMDEAKKVGEAFEKIRADVFAIRGF